MWLGGKLSCIVQYTTASNTVLSSHNFPLLSLAEVEQMVSFLKAIENDTLVLIATYDDGATK